MYRVNGVDLDNPTYGWILRPGTVPYSTIVRDLSGVESHGRNGYSPIASVDAPTIIPIQINTPPSGWEALQALMRQPTLTITRTDKPGVSVVGRVASSSIDEVFARNEWIDVTYFVELYDPYWRDTSTTTTTPAALSVGSTTVNLFSGISAPVQDAIIRIKGGVTSPRVTDSGGSWFSVVGIIPDGQYIRFESETNSLFITTTDTWTGGTDASGGVDFGGPRGVFEITEKVTNLASRTASLSVSALSTFASPTIQVRGKSAYAL